MLRRIIAVAFSLIAFAELGAQDALPAGYAVLQGVAVDSVRGGLLRGATVGVLGPSRMSRGGTPEDFIMPDEIEAIEVYTRSFVPFEFQTQGYDRCTTVAIWTRWKLRLFEA